MKRGEDLFHNSPVAACASCHMVNGKGGDVGPILDGIALRAEALHHGKPHGSEREARQRI